MGGIEEVFLMRLSRGVALVILKTKNAPVPLLAPRAATLELAGDGDKFAGFFARGEVFAGDVTVERGRDDKHIAVSFDDVSDIVPKREFFFDAGDESRACSF